MIYYINSEPLYLNIKMRGRFVNGFILIFCNIFVYYNNFVIYNASCCG